MSQKDFSKCGLAEVTGSWGEKASSQEQGEIDRNRWTKFGTVKYCSNSRKSMVHCSNAKDTTHLKYGH